jgi:arylsulfatase
MDSHRNRPKAERQDLSRRIVLLAGTTLAAASALGSAASAQTTQPQQRAATPSASPPNILVIWGDDIGTWNISHNNRGMMGYQTPNIDRIAREGVGFTDYYGQQSCTAGRAA